MTTTDSIPIPRVRLTSTDPHAVIARLFDAIAAETRLTQAALVLLGYGLTGTGTPDDLLAAGQALAADATVRDALSFTVREARR